MLECWGKNEPTTFKGEMPVLKGPEQIGMSTDWQHVSVGYDHVCVSGQLDLRLRCTGDTSEGELGNALGPSAEFVTPEPSFYSSHFSAGQHFTCAIRDSDQAVICFGSNKGGQLGRGSDETSSNKPEVVCLTP
jgi:alpha-tubulin suppressor-like RCC1 family protein